ncbi:MAG: NAD-dependent epimerase/dehydratase family protein, partial [Bacteroidetes bacterium]
MDKNSKIYIAGHKGMVGSAILRKLQQEGFNNFVLKTSAELDLRNQQKVEDFFEKHSETGQLVMLLQEEIIFTEYYRCYCIGRKHVRIMPYE